MKEIITYLIEALVCSGVLVALYSLLLERRVRFVVCRLYLLISTAVAALIPAIKIPVWAAKTVYVQALPVAVGELDATAEIVADVPATITSQAVCIVVWLLGFSLIAGTMVWQLVRMRRFRRSAAEVDFGDFKLLKINDRISSFSFFRTIFVSADTPADDLKIIIAHEAGHIRHRHSAERIAMELLKAVLWWNPFVWIAARRLTEVQEYEADSEVLRNGCNIDWYINTLLKNLFGYSPDIANGLRDSLTKKRLKMMTMKKDGRYALLRMAAIVPVVAGLITAFSFTAKATQVVSTPVDAANPLVIVDGQVCNEPLESIDTDAIKSITVVKDGVAKEVYAHLGDVSDGVIVVETKEAAAAKSPSPEPQNTITVSGEMKVSGPDEVSVKDVLIVVDGKEFEGNLEDIDADTIENMTILKSDSATAAYGAVYGEKGANGVIIINTKRGGEDAVLRAQQMPTFEGGDLLTFREWVMMRIRFPQEALENGVYGRVVVSFVIDREGKLGDVNVLRSPDALLSQEVERVLALSPAWTPGKNAGEPVSVKYTIPVDFAVATDEGIQRDDTPATEGSVAQLSVIGYGK